MKIQVKTKSNYGTTMIYPVCEKAELFASLVGKKTLSLVDLNYIKQLGYEVEQVHIDITL